MTSLDGINDRSIQSLLRGENDSKQLDESQANEKRAPLKTPGWEASSRVDSFDRCVTCE